MMPIYEDDFVEVKSQKTKEKKSNKIVELYINDKLYKAVPYNKWDEEDEKLKTFLKRKGYFEQYDDLPGFKHQHEHPHVWIIWDKFIILVTCYKIKTDLVDKHGNILYTNDIVKYTDGCYTIESCLCEKPFNKGYYVREYLTHQGMCSRVRDTDITDENIKNITKRRDVINLPRKQWNQPELFDIKTL